MGLVPLHAAHCFRCGAEIRRDSDVVSELACPACKARLFHSAVGDAHLDQCHSCGGVWAGQSEFEKIAADHEERGGVLGALPGEGPRGPIQAEEIHYRPCPLCQKLMNRTNYGRTSGVILDVCKDHGLWFDRDELRRVLEFIEKGGLDKNRARELQDLEEQRRSGVHQLQDVSMMGSLPVNSQGGGLLDVLVRGLFGF
jgi:Zn-finger nucleic acid-binding protein